MEVSPALAMARVFANVLRKCFTITSMIQSCLFVLKVILFDSGGEGASMEERMEASPALAMARVFARERAALLLLCFTITCVIQLCRNSNSCFWEIVLVNLSSKIIF